jgi:hypothetical protein
MMKLRVIKKVASPAAGLAIVASATLALAILAFATPPASLNFGVHASVFDPFQTKLVSAEWENGAGCPTGAKEAIYPTNTITTYSDPACTPGDPDDHDNKGLVLAKMGQQANNAAAGADITGLDNKISSLTEIGYDIHIGTHCDGGAPRFNITTTNGKFYFLACSSPAPTTIVAGDNWKRLRWGNGTAGSVMGFNPADGFALEPITDPIKSIQIVFDETGESGSPPSLAVIDNIDINGVIQGKP